MVILALWLTHTALAVDLKNRSTSRSGQFVVYCDDREVRSRVVSSVEELKGDVLRILQEGDSWDFPIIITIEKAEPGKPLAPVSLQLTTTIAGPKIDIVVRVGDDPSKVFLHRHVLRAIFLEMAYRDRASIKAGERYTEPPWWLADGIFQSIRRREDGAKADIFKSIVNTEKLPELERFLQRPPTLLDTPAGTVDSACAMCLVEALLALPNGAQNMGRFIRSSPDASGDMAGLLAAHFPALGGSPQSLAKWWALQIARFANSEQWEGMPIAETEKELSALLSLEVAMDKSGRVQKFELSEFAHFIKAPGAATAVNVARVKIAALVARANPLYRPIITEYEQVCSLLSVRKMKGVAERIASIERYRASIVQRMGQITDYLNWYEATQDTPQIGTFERYLRHARESARPAQPPPADPRIVEYLDALEKDFRPLTPNTLPGTAPNGAASR